jgi:SAM-dependent methyltransferase
MDVRDLMREDWNRRARQDAHFCAAFGRRNQDEAEFLASAAEVAGILEQALARLPPGPASSRRALEIGCGPGRLMLPMSRHVGEIHGVDISDEMAALARDRLRHTPHAHVHVTNGADLAMARDAHFDFVYSYTVFQHIPDPEIVRNYLAEARRALKTGGVLCCQLRGAPPLRTEMEREPATWTGCYFSGEEMAAFARERDFHLVSLTGLDTQYMWTTFVKPDDSRRPADFSRAALKAVTASSRGESRVPARGRDAVVSLWIEGLPAGCHLGNLEVAFRETRTRGCYLSALAETGGCQLNVRIPKGTPPGQVEVALWFEDRRLGDSKSVEVLPPAPRNPSVLTVTDAIAIDSKYRIEMGGVKVTMEDVERPQEVFFAVAGRPVAFQQFECKDPVTDTYTFAFHLSHKTRLGVQPLVARVSGRELAPIPIEIAGLSERRPAKLQRGQAHNQQHNGEAHGASGAPLRPAVEGKRNLASALARWLHHQKP